MQKETETDATWKVDFHTEDADILRTGEFWFGDRVGDRNGHGGSLEGW